MTMNGKTIPLPKELTTPPIWVSQTGRGSSGSSSRRYVASGLTERRGLRYRRGARSPRADDAAGGDVRDLARVLRRDRVRVRGGSPGRGDGIGRGSADRALSRVRSRGGRVADRVGGGARRRPLRTGRDRRSPAEGSAHPGGALRARQRPPRPLWQADRTPGLEAAGFEASRAADLLDGLARRPG